MDSLYYFFYFFLKEITKIQIFLFNEYRSHQDHVLAGVILKKFRISFAVMTLHIYSFSLY